jgi:hypothetical protein
MSLTGPQWRQYRNSPVVDDALIEEEWDLAITGREFPVDVFDGFLSSNTFNNCGVAPALGRKILASDAIDGKDSQPVILLSYKFWQSASSSPWH